VPRPGWTGWFADAVALAAAVGLLIAVRDRWSLVLESTEYFLAWVVVVTAAIVVFAGAIERRPPRALWAGFAALAFVLPALALRDVTAIVRVLSVALAAALPVAIAAFTLAAIRRSSDVAFNVLVAVTIVDIGARVFLRDPRLDADCSVHCARNPFLFEDHRGVVLFVDRVLAVTALAWCTMTLIDIVAAHTKAPAARVSGTLGAAAAGIAAVCWIVWPGTAITAVDTALTPALLVLALGPAFVLAASPELLAWRTRLRVAALASDLSTGFERDGVAGHLRWALDDPSVRLVFPVEDSFIDGHGIPAELARHRATTVLTKDGEPIAVIEHSPSSSALLGAAVNPAVTIAAENERLHAEAQAHLASLQRSRRQIVERADETRRRLERDLHDGAQQQLLLLGLELARAVDNGADDERERYRSSLEHAQSALTELRRLVHDQLPPVLDELGLVEALRSLAEESPVPMLLDCNSANDRPRLAVERVAYGVVLSSLSEAEAHGASVLSVRVENVKGVFTVHIRHDGAGVADHTDDEDRVGALGGRLDVTRAHDGAGAEYVASFP
jgi:signal transduction histidine kinase